MPRRRPAAPEQGWCGESGLRTAVQTVCRTRPPHSLLLSPPHQAPCLMPPGPSPAHLGPPLLQGTGTFPGSAGEVLAPFSARVGMNDLFFLSQHTVNPAGRLNMSLMMFIPADEVQLGRWALVGPGGRGLLKAMGWPPQRPPPRPALSRPPGQVGGPELLGSPRLPKFSPGMALVLPAPRSHRPLSPGQQQRWGGGQGNGGTRHMASQALGSVSIS